MTIFSRLVAAATTISCLVGLVGISSPSVAAELGASVLPAPMLSVSVNNLPTLSLVPSSAPTVTAETIATAQVQSFASLADAVAAQDAAVADDTVKCLAGAVYFESKGEPLPGQLAVAQVIINRTKSGRFPSDICGVVKQRGQFSFVRGGAMPSIAAGIGAYRVATAVAKVAMQDIWNSPAPKALFFHARRVAPGWGKTQVAAIGNHVFYR